MEELSFKLEIYEGPLDLMLDLIRKHKLNIRDIEISILLEQFLLYLEKIGAYNWGFVLGKYQTHEPWNGIWERMERGEEFDVTKWQHDLFRPSLRPYDPREIELIKYYNQKADERFAAGRDTYRY